ncbi:F-box/FBD/LRR-repeat protein At5g18770-like [Raphanus sativus]|uniref:F-box/FBD/LRR-repeat protein At5g18770-like n=1 Tax=Raphanus sativus TaxID=3726 RepID=A0A9W3CKK7_RAPSA|nr:F-box/FBD/LRR-repeat protein At5g18770-like [Raphanus sativus]
MIFTIPKSKILRFSHQIPASRVTKEIQGVLKEIFEVDSRALPANCASSLSPFRQSFRRRRLRVSSSSVREGEDRISLLPEPLLCHILSFLTTEEAVWTSVLSSPWRHLWKCVPRLELDTSSFASDRVCVDFIDEFLAFQGKPYYLREFKLTIDHDVFHSDVSLYEPCLGRVDMRKMERYQVENRFEQLSVDNIATPPLTLSACEALVCLKLHFVRLNEFVSLSLPCLKTMYLEDVVMPSDAAAEALISSSPVLEVLKISVSVDDAVVALRVCSKSLKSFALKGVERFYVRGRYSVLIDAPKLEHLSLMDYYHFKSFKIISAADVVKVDIDVEFGLMKGHLSETKMIYNLVKSFSGVEDMTISWTSLKFIYSSFHQMKRTPKFHDLTVLRATMCLNASPKLIPVVLESCPNLKHLTLELLIHYPEVIARLSNVLPRCLVSSLVSVEMDSPVTEITTELDLARYFMKNSTTFKKVVLRLNQSSTGEKHKPGVLEQLIESPRRSSLCQFEVIPVVTISESSIA